MLGLILLFIVCLSGSAFLVWYVITKKSIALFFISITFISITCGCLITKISTYSNPTALDVYRGNTALQITYRDSIPVDTVVVFKN